MIYIQHLSHLSIAWYCLHLSVPLPFSLPHTTSFLPLSGPQAPSTPSTTAPKESVASLSTPTPVPLGGQNGAAANHAPGTSPSSGCCMIVRIVFVLGCIACEASRCLNVCGGSMCVCVCLCVCYFFVSLCGMCVDVLQTVSPSIADNHCRPSHTQQQ